VLWPKKINAQGDSVTTPSWARNGHAPCAAARNSLEDIKEWLNEVDCISYTHIYHEDNAPTDDLAQQRSSGAVTNCIEATINVRFR